MNVKIKPLVYGVLTNVPIFVRMRYGGKKLSSLGAESAQYCYSVWLRHLKKYMACTSQKTVPKIVAELGPGNSIGVGIAALLTGAERYYAFDLIDYTDLKLNLELVEKIADLINSRTTIPHTENFSKIKPYLDDYSFPQELESIYVTKEKIESVKQSILNVNTDESLIRYFAPWTNVNLSERGSVDFIFSQAVLEHVDSLEETYLTMKEWLKGKGVISHQIDFRSHGLTKEWNGHWYCSDLTWKLIRGKRPYLINRAPLSKHLKIMKENKFKILTESRVESENALEGRRLSLSCKNFTPHDLKTSGFFFQASLSD